jgi:hypothetical protein
MPIKGLSDRGEEFPVIGQIRKGAKKRKIKKGDREIEIFGEELTYFRVEWGEGETEAARIFESVYGKTPNAVRVLFPFDDISRIWDPWKVAFTAGTMLGRSDGEYVYYLQDNKGEVLVRDWLDRDGKKMPHPANNIAGFDYQGKPVKFINSGILKVLILELPRAAYLEVITSSTHDILNISSQLKAFYRWTGERLAGIPFLLRRVPKMISTPGDKGGPKVRRKKYLISIEADPDWVQRQFGKLRTLALPSYDVDGMAVAELPPGEVLETDIDPEEIDPDEVDAGEVSDVETTPAESPPPSPVPPRMVDVLGSESVTYAAKEWNCTNEQAAQELAKRKLGKSIAWDVLVSTVRTVKAELTK